MIGCGPHPAVTIAFFLSYIMMSSFILINIFVAIIVDSVSAHYKVQRDHLLWGGTLDCIFGCDAVNTRLALARSAVGLSSRVMQSLPSPGNIILVTGMGAGKDSFATEGGTVQVGSRCPRGCSHIKKHRKLRCPLFQLWVVDSTYVGGWSRSRTNTHAPTKATGDVSGFLFLLTALTKN